jgi:hypothetical protein
MLYCEEIVAGPICKNSRSNGRDKKKKEYDAAEVTLLFNELE